MDTYTQAITLKRRHRGLEEKLRMVEKTLAEGASVALIARTLGVNANLVFSWRRPYQARRLRGSRARLLPVRVTADASTTPSFPTSLPGSGGKIQIQLHHAPGSIEGSIDPGMLRASIIETARILDPRGFPVIQSLFRVPGYRWVVAAR